MLLFLILKVIFFTMDKVKNKSVYLFKSSLKF